MNKKTKKLTNRLLLNKQALKTVESNPFKRTILTITMISLFTYIIISDKILLLALIIFVQCFVFKEVLNVAVFRRRISLLSKYLSYHFFFAANLFFLHKYIVNVLKGFLPEITRFYVFFAFSFYIVGFCLFTFNLRKKGIKDQFILFAVTHVSVYYLSKAVQLAIKNLTKAKFWFVFPCMLIITNDIGAYIVGKSMGKRPLLQISPKKTQEGFIGAFFMTLIVGYFTIFCTLKYKWIGEEYLKIFCEKFCIKIFGLETWVPVIYLHGTVFIFFASFIAPFGGFFASGYKRMFKVKDFGSIIPGHGGIADRMDCQFIMTLFTTVYVDTFLDTNMSTVKKIACYIKDHLNKDEIEELIRIIS